VLIYRCTPQIQIVCTYGDGGGEKETERRGERARREMERWRDGGGRGEGGSRRGVARKQARHETLSMAAQRWFGEVMKMTVMRAMGRTAWKLTCS